MPKNVLVTTVSPIALSNEEINSRLAALVASDPNLAIAIATRALTVPVPKSRASGSASTQETETERACRCAGFTSGNRSKLLTACIVILGNENEAHISEDSLRKATNLPSFRVRADMQTVQDRINDRTSAGLAKFPLIPAIGYNLCLATEGRGADREYKFSRAVPVPVKEKTPRKARKLFKGKATTYNDAVVETAKEESKD